MPLMKIIPKVLTPEEKKERKMNFTIELDEEEINKLMVRAYVNCFGKNYVSYDDDNAELYYNEIQKLLKESSVL